MFRCIATVVACGLTAASSWAQQKPTGTGDYLGGEARWFAAPHRAQKASDLIGKPVKSSSDESLGKVEDLVVDPGNGRILYGVLSFGGVLGIGDKFFAIPWASLELPADAKNFVLAVDKETLKKAEGFDKSHWPNAADERWATNTNKYYGQPPYWSRSGNESGARPQNEQPDGDAAVRERWFHPASGWQKASNLIGKNVKNLQNENLGDMNDLIIDPDTGRIMWGVVLYLGKYIAVPWSAFSLSTSAEHFALDETPQRLKDAAGFDRSTWPNFTDRSWSVKEYSYFKQRPYWSERPAQPGPRPTPPSKPEPATPPSGGEGKPSNPPQPAPPPPSSPPAPPTAPPPPVPPAPNKTP